MDLVQLAFLLEKWVSLGIGLVALALAILSFIAWRRERSRRMAVVTIGYGLFALFGFLVAGEPWITRLGGYAAADVIEHGASVFVLAGLVVFFFALSRD
ncbi:MAG: hypothetical protein WDA16_11890 [Candidatus Thermoplasmatota archaeon]